MFCTFRWTSLFSSFTVILIRVCAEFSVDVSDETVTNVQYIEAAWNPCSQVKLHVVVNLTLLHSCGHAALHGSNSSSEHHLICCWSQTQYPHGMSTSSRYSISGEPDWGKFSLLLDCYLRSFFFCFWIHCNESSHMVMLYGWVVNSCTIIFLCLRRWPLSLFLHWSFWATNRS